MRIMVGLTPATRGHTTIGGHRYADLPNPGRHVGVLLDASAQHAGRTGREVLTIGAVTMGLPMSRVDEMLELVSLSPSEAKRRVKNYSLGMRQRLGIAHALLGDPQILILDEPANGLDPAGIHWMRGLLREYAERGGTVCLSSHLLYEVEKIADELILIGHGRIVAQGTKQDLLQTRGAYVKAVEHEALLDALNREGVHVVTSGDGLRSDAEPLQVGKIAAAHNITLVELRPAEGAGLEEMFLELTADTQRDDNAVAATAPEGADK
jgi:ABC-2 type transport system ATP-binding protein